MSGPFETTADDITALSDVQLTQLVHRLLLLEAEKLGLPRRMVDVSLSIDIPDGGEDGRIEWEGDPDPATSRWLPRRVCLFQMKATDMGPSKCRGEVVVERSGTKGAKPRGRKSEKPQVSIALKPRVADLVEREGSYILCYSRPCAGTHVTDRVAAFRGAIAEVVGPAKAAAVDIQVYGAERLSSWANEHASAITFVLSRARRALPLALQTWSSWADLHQSPLTYFSDEPRLAIASELKTTLQSGGGVARLAGLSGLGKTRLALELFRPPESAGDEPDQAVLSAACVYVGDGANAAEVLRQTMLSLREHRVRAIVVVDECPLDLHEKLEPIAVAPDSTLSLLTLDYDPGSHPRSPRCRFFSLETLGLEPMKELLRRSHAHVPDAHLARIAEFAQGYPRMAHLLVEAIQDGREHLWELVPVSVVERLVYRHLTGEERRLLLLVARALSVFEHVGVDGIAAHELDDVAAHLCGQPRRDVYAVVRDLERAGIVLRRGDYVRVTPLPIAVTLAGQWWDDRSVDEAQELLLGGRLTPELVEATANQLKRLSGHQWVQHLITSLYGPSSPFRQRDLLDSARGSRLASSLAEVNPRAVCDALTYVFGTMTPDQAKTVRDGRRDLVWCLEKLAWWPETFQEAAWLLLLFAVGENESWGNNATKQFAGLFHVYLGGTETPAAHRLTVLRRALGTQASAFEPLVVQALGEALASGHFSRMGGNDAQGGRLPRKDWEPRTWGEIWSYWREALQLLHPFLLRDDDLGDSSRETVGNRVRGMIGWGAIDVVEEAVDVVHPQHAWPEILDGLRSALNYDGGDYPDELKVRVEALVTRLTPTDLASRVSSIVSEPSWNELRKEGDGKVVVVAEERAEALGRELATHLDDLMPLLPRLLKGEQRQGYKFGHALGGAVTDPVGLTSATVGLLMAIPEAERNPVVLMGLAKGASDREPDATRQVVRALYDNPETRGLGVRCMLAIGVDDDDVDLVADGLRDGTVPSSLAHSFAYGGVLIPLKPATVARLVSACAGADPLGPLVALELLGMRTHRAAMDEELLPVARDLLQRSDLLGLVTTHRGGLAEHHLETLAKDYLGQTGDEQFAALLTRALIESLATESGFPASHHVRKLLPFLLERHPEAVWQELRRGFEQQEGGMALRLELTLERLDLVGLVGADRLLDWCDSYERARHWVARMMEPLREPDPDALYPSWTPFALALLERFGSDADVRSSLSASIYSGAWGGSAVPRLTLHRDAYKELTTHPNPDIARWALDAVGGLDAEIEKERKRDEEREFGILR
jgi:hypothetical protein